MAKEVSWSGTPAEVSKLISEWKKRNWRVFLNGIFLLKHFKSHHLDPFGGIIFRQTQVSTARPWFGLVTDGMSLVTV
jgi:hypothetical protein